MPAASLITSSPTSLRTRLLLSPRPPRPRSLAMAAAALWGLGVVHRDIGAAVPRGYQEMRRPRGRPPRRPSPRPPSTRPTPTPAPLAEIRAARSRLDLFAGAPPTSTPRRWLDDSRAPEQDSAALAECQLLLAAALSSPEPTPAPPAPCRPPPATPPSPASPTSPPPSAAHRRQRVRRRIQAPAVSRLSLALAAVVLLASAAGGLLLHRRLVRPLVSLRAATGRIAAGNFADRLPETGDRELALLATDFNAMAGELEAIHADLARQVETRTAELLRSRRLASVGFLAAGVAHEINNPLGIIAGYTERSSATSSARRTDLDPETSTRIEEALRIICDEAFRCKAITEQLLALAPATPAPNTGARSRSIAPAHDRPRPRRRPGRRGRPRPRSPRRPTGPRPHSPRARLHRHRPHGRAPPGLLNLILNAADATDPVAGQISVDLTRDGDQSGSPSPTTAAASPPPPSPTSSNPSTPTTPPTALPAAPASASPSPAPSPKTSAAPSPRRVPAPIKAAPSPSASRRPNRETSSSEAPPLQRRGDARRQLKSPNAH